MAEQSEFPPGDGDDEFDEYFKELLGEEQKQTLDLCITKMLEVMEWENTLDPIEKSKRRLRKYIHALPQSLTFSIESDNPYFVLLCLNSIIRHVEVIYGENWRDQFNTQDDNQNEEET